MECSLHMHQVSLHQLEDYVNMITPNVVYSPHRVSSQMGSMPEAGNLLKVNTPKPIDEYCTQRQLA